MTLVVHPMILEASSTALQNYVGGDVSAILERTVSSKVTLMIVSQWAYDSMTKIRDKLVRGERVVAPEKVQRVAVYGTTDPSRTRRKTRTYCSGWKLTYWIFVGCAIVTGWILGWSLAVISHMKSKVK